MARGAAADALINYTFDSKVRNQQKKNDESTKSLGRRRSHSRALLLRYRFNRRQNDPAIHSVRRTSRRQMIRKRTKKKNNEKKNDNNKNTMK